MMDMRELVASFWGPPDRRSGNWWWWRCRLHAEEKASFGATDTHAHCFGCGAHFKPRKFLSEVVGRGYLADSLSSHSSGKVYLKAASAPPELWRMEVEKHLARASQTLFSPQGARARAELAQRAIGPDVWKKYRVGAIRERIKENGFYLPEGIILPAIVNGEVWSYNVRTWMPGLRYVRPKNDVSVLFGLDQLEEFPVLVVCEGEMDALTAAQALQGKADVIALRGAGNWRVMQAWASKWADYDKVVIAIDNDDAGNQARNELLKIFPEWESFILPPGFDLGDLAKAGRIRELRGVL